MLSYHSFLEYHQVVLMYQTLLMHTVQQTRRPLVNQQGHSNLLPWLDRNFLMIVLVSLFVNGKEVYPKFFWLTNATLCERMVIQNVSYQPPFISKDWCIPEQESLLYRTQLFLLLGHIPTIDLTLDLILELHLRVEVVFLVHNLLDDVVHLIRIEKEITLQDLLSLIMLCSS